MGLRFAAYCRCIFRRNIVKNCYFNCTKINISSYCHIFNNCCIERLGVRNILSNSNSHRNANKIGNVGFSSKFLSGWKIGISLGNLPASRNMGLKNIGSIYHCSTRNFSEQIDMSGQGWFYKVLYDSPPVLYAQDFLLYAHNITGLPWWATIVVSTVVLRSTVTFPLALYQNYIMAKLEIIQLQLKEISKEMGKETSFAVKKFNWTEKQAKAVYIRSMKKQWKILVEKENCHPAKASLLVLVQLPMWVSMSLGLRNLVYMYPTPNTAAQVTAWELSGGGALWFHNLLLPDTSWILPICLGLVNLTVIEIQNLSRVKQPGKVQKILTNVFRGFSIVMIPVAASVPSALCLYWVASSTTGIIHNLILLSPSIRKYVGIPQTDSVSKEPYRHIYRQLATRFGVAGPPHPPST